MVGLMGSPEIYYPDISMLIRSADQDLVGSIIAQRKKWG